MELTAELQWGPLADVLDRMRKLEHALLVVICPFIKREALDWILSRQSAEPDLKFIVRWRGADLLSGVSDISIYEDLKARGMKLYAHPNIHLKLFLFSDGAAVLSTGNVTMRGLGLCEPSNVEATTITALSPIDWSRVNQIFNESVLIDDELFQRATRYVETHNWGHSPAQALDLTPTVSRQFSILSLPASENIDALFDFYRSHPKGNAIGIGAPEFSHDIELYGIPPNLTQDAFFEVLSTNFTKHPFIQTIVRLIRERGSARFGLVKEWIQQTCSDKPTPYRWELTRNIQILYSWLVRFFPDMSWSIPGKRSQVITVKKKDK
jgi:hypothetical protein